MFELGVTANIGCILVRKRRIKRRMKGGPLVAIIARLDLLYLNRSNNST
jgi:hypothetical protein